MSESSILSTEEWKSLDMLEPTILSSEEYSSMLLDFDKKAEQIPFNLDFEFVKDEHVRNKFMHYSIKMRDVSPCFTNYDEICLDDKSSLTTAEKQYIFYVSATALLEELVNYFFSTMYSNIDEIQRDIWTYTHWVGYQYKIRKNVKTVNEIAFIPKINTICLMLMSGFYTGTLRSLRQFLNQTLDVQKRNKDFDKFHNDYRYIDIYYAIMMLVTQVRKRIEG